MAGEFDGQYDHTKPWQNNSNYASGALNPYADTGEGLPRRSSYNGPWASNMERLTSQALMVAAMPGAELQQVVRPPLPQIRLFPDRFGFGVRQQPDIDDVVSLDRVYMEPRVSWYSGSPAGYSGSSTNSLGSV
jgi:hypothetical protein